MKNILLHILRILALAVTSMNAAPKTAAAAKEAGVAFVDLFHPSLALYQSAAAPLTINGSHLTEDGNRQLAEVIARALLGKPVSASASIDSLRRAVTDKDMHWHNRYRASDGNDVWGGRSTLKFVNDQSNAEVLQHELSMLDVMTANRDGLVDSLDKEQILDLLAYLLAEGNARHAAFQHAH